MQRAFDSLDGGKRAVAVDMQCGSCHRGVNTDDRQRMGDDVMEFAGEALPLGRDGLVLALFAASSRSRTLQSELASRRSPYCKDCPAAMSTALISR